MEATDAHRCTVAPVRAHSSVDGARLKRAREKEGVTTMSRTSTRRSARSALAIIFALLLAVVASVSTAGAEEAADIAAQGGVSLLADNVCPDGIDDWVKYDVDTQGDFDLYYQGTKIGTATTNAPGKGQVTVTLPPGWTADICVKGGQTMAIELGLVNGGYTVTPILGGAGLLADVSHFSYRLHPPVYQGQWCSPGFWKNNPLSWPAPYTADSIYPGTSLTFGYILANPKVTARTGAFEGVADLLSTAHPGVDFLGERVADSCPLSADASMK